MIEYFETLDDEDLLACLALGDQPIESIRAAVDGMGREALGAKEGGGRWFALQNSGRRMWNGYEPTVRAALCRDGRIKAEVEVTAHAIVASLEHALTGKGVPPATLSILAVIAFRRAHSICA